MASSAVLLVDDEPRLVQAWIKLFASEPEFDLVATLDTADGLVEKVNEFDPRIVVLDLGLPGIDPLEVLRSLSESRPDVRIVVHSGQSDGRIREAAFDAGAWGFVDKLAPPEEVFSVLRRVAAGEVVLESA